MESQATIGLPRGADGVCKNCGHYLHLSVGKRWEHFTRFYKPSGFPFSTLRCYAPGDEPYGGFVELPEVRQSCCGCMDPEPEGEM